MGQWFLAREPACLLADWSSRIIKLFEQNGKADLHTILGANFLCSQQFKETWECTCIISTIAYQLARKCKSYADTLHNLMQFIRTYPVEGSSLLDLGSSPTLNHYLIVVNALDEIGLTFLCNLLIGINEFDLSCFKFLKSSQSDPKVAAPYESFKTVCCLQEVPIEEAKSDIETYLKTQLPMLVNSPEFAKLGRCAVHLCCWPRLITIGEWTEMLNNFLSK